MSTTQTETKTETEIQQKTFQGFVNTHDKAPKPSRIAFDDGNTRFSFNLAYYQRDKKGNILKTDDGKNMIKDVNVVARNQTADQLYAALVGDDIKSFTLKGNYNPRLNTIYPDQIQLHPIITVEGKITHLVEEANYKDLLVSQKHDGKDKSSAFNVRIYNDKELNGAELEIGKTIGINGQSNVFTHKDGERSVNLKPWNVAPTAQEVNKIVKHRQTQNQNKGQQQEMGV